MIARMLRGGYLACLCLLGCAGKNDPPPEFVRQVGTVGRVCLQRDDGGVVALAVQAERRHLPRAAAVTVAALQPGGEHTDFELVWSGGRSLYRAITWYAAGNGHVRTVLVDRDGHVIERSHQVTPIAGGDLAQARAALSSALDGQVARFEIVHGEGASEWLRAHATDGTRVVDCDLDGRLRGQCKVEWRAQ